MFIVGVVGAHGKTSIANSIADILQLKKYKINIIESGSSISTPDKIKDYISTLNKNNSDILIINLTNEGVNKELYNEIKFDIIINSLTQKVLRDYYRNTDLIEKYQKIYTRLKNRSYLIVNIDDENYITQLQGLETYVLTYGFNSKATITASSIDDNCNKVLICQQRTIKTLFNTMIEPQEIIINIKNCEHQDIYNALSIVAAGLVFDIKSDLFSNSIF